MRFSVFGINFHISVPFVVLISFLLIIDKTGLMTASLAAVAVHELGHIIAMKSLKCLPKEIDLHFGGILICGTAYCTFSENAIIAFSGPFANFLFFAIYTYIYIIYRTPFFCLFFGIPRRKYYL